MLLSGTPRLGHGQILHCLQTRADLSTRTVRFTCDPAGRQCTHTPPDLRACPEPVKGVIQTAYDASDNVASITPLSRPAHAVGIGADCLIGHTITVSALTPRDARAYRRATSTSL